MLEAFLQTDLLQQSSGALNPVGFWTFVSVLPRMGWLLRVGEDGLGMCVGHTKLFDSQLAARGVVCRSICLGW